jgi:hypothetical protein
MQTSNSGTNNNCCQKKNFSKTISSFPVDTYRFCLVLIEFGEATINSSGQSPLASIIGITLLTPNFPASQLHDAITLRSVWPPIAVGHPFSLLFF